jgi:hypothetical protein
MTVSTTASIILVSLMAAMTADDGCALFSPYARAVEKYMADPSSPVIDLGAFYGLRSHARRPPVLAYAHLQRAGTRTAPPLKSDPRVRFQIGNTLPFSGPRCTGTALDTLPSGGKSSESSTWTDVQGIPNPLAMGMSA